MSNSRNIWVFPAAAFVVATMALTSLVASPAAAREQHRLPCRNTALCGGGGRDNGHRLATANYMVACTTPYCGSGGKP
jgi:hypothetical protein